jgi:hypothetical protein
MDAAVEAPKIASEPLELAEHLLDIQRGEDVLRRESPWQLPAWPVLVVLVLAPPLGCVAWYLAWRHFHPESARQVRRWRSRAARRALKALQGHHALDGEQVAEALTIYLRERFGLLSATPTPAEVRALLQQAGAPEAAQMAGSRLFADCDAVRYAPAARVQGLREEAVAFIGAVEGGEWSWSS